MYLVITKGKDYVTDYKCSTLAQAIDECVDNYHMWLTKFIETHNHCLDTHGLLDLTSEEEKEFNEMIRTHESFIVDDKLNVIKISNDELSDIDWCLYREYRKNHCMHSAREGDTIIINHKDGTSTILTVVNCRMVQTGLCIYKAIDLTDTNRIVRGYEFTDGDYEKINFIRRSKGE